MNAAAAVAVSAALLRILSADRRTDCRAIDVERRGCVGGGDER